MKKLLLLAAIVIPVISYAADKTLSPFDGAKDGVNVWSAEKLNMPTKSHVKSFANKQYNEATWTNERVESLFQVGKTGKKEASQYDKVTNQADTHLRSDISKIKLSFKFNGIPDIGKQSVLGFAPAGGYGKDGWNGVVEFIQMPDLGVCSFTTFAIKSVILAKESLTRAVNGKQAENDISGNYTNGFLYHVNWYTNTRRNSFECANKNLDPEILKRMTRIANKIDKAIH